MNSKFRKTPIAIAAALAAFTLYGCESHADDQPHDDGMSQTGETASGVARAVERTGQSVSDMAISARVKTKLIDSESVDADAVNVDTANGVVTLSGTVANDDARATAEKLASEVSGVESVDNRLTIGDEATLTQKAESTVDDVTITAKVKTGLIDEDSLSAAGINVDTSNQIVTLSGTVTSMHDKELAGEIAANVPGVHSVDNRLQIESGS